MAQKETETWYDDESGDEGEEYTFAESEIITSPNDFNVLTLFNFVSSGVVQIPGFQRNYVWDIKRASKLIESIILQLPIPQIFLYEQGRNQFLVIDGQQRLMSIYYFIRGRFPKIDKRTKLRRIVEQHGSIPDDILRNNDYFSEFNLVLPENLPDHRNRLNGLNYETLGDYRSSFDMRPIRSIIVKRVSSKHDDSVIYEIFNRLNTSGVNLSAMEIRMSLYHSDFYDMLARINAHPEWRRIINIDEPDLHMKDLEFLLRAFALLIAGNDYKASMVKFLNNFSNISRGYPSDYVQYLESLFASFLASCAHLPNNSFYASNRFRYMHFEAVFVAVCADPYAQRQLVSGTIDPDSVAKLSKDETFVETSQRATTNKANVMIRLERARDTIEVHHALVESQT